jgi:hypothetical protein
VLSLTTKKGQLYAVLFFVVEIVGEYIAQNIVVVKSTKPLYIVENYF